MALELIVVSSAELSGWLQAFHTEPTWDVAKIMLGIKSNLSSY